MKDQRKKIFALGDFLYETHIDTAKDIKVIKGGGLANAMLNFLDAPVDIKIGTYGPKQIDHYIQESTNATVTHSPYLYQKKLPHRIFHHYEFSTNVSSAEDIVESIPNNNSDSYNIEDPFDVLYIYDHGLGFWGDEFRIQYLEDLLKSSNNKILFLDSRSPDVFFANLIHLSPYFFRKLHANSHTFYIKANEDEMRVLAPFLINNEELKRSQLNNLFILNTRSSNGSALCNIKTVKSKQYINQIFSAPSPSPNILSPNNIGCGDSFCAFFLIAKYIYNLDFYQSLVMANVAGNIQASKEHQMLQYVKVSEVLKYILDFLPKH